MGSKTSAPSPIVPSARPRSPTLTDVRLTDAPATPVPTDTGVLDVVSVVGALSLAAVAIIATVVTTAMTLRAARRGRLTERRNDAYLELITLVEREGQFTEADYAYYWYSKSSEDIPIPPAKPKDEPSEIDKARASALVAAYGTEAVESKYKAWRGSLLAIQSEYQQLAHAHDGEKYIPPEDWQKLETTLNPAEKSVRKILIDTAVLVLQDTSARLPR